MLHNILIAVDGSRNSLRVVEYAGRVFAPNAEVRLMLFHVLPAISRTSLNKEQIKAIDGRKAERADLDDVLSLFAGSAGNREEQPDHHGDPRGPGNVSAGPRRAG